MINIWLRKKGLRIPKSSIRKNLLKRHIKENHFDIEFGERYQRHTQ